MNEIQIVCKVHDDRERVIEVGFRDGTRRPMLEIWNYIKNKLYSFYTLERGKKTEVKAIEREGTKYLTTNPDGITPNNLDELRSCGVSYN